MLTVGCWPTNVREVVVMPAIIRTVTGDVPAESLEVTLVHEHLYTDLRPRRGRVPVPVQTAAALAANRPLLAEARSAGLTALVECTPPGIGRRTAFYARLARESGIAVVAATGFYKEPLLLSIAYDWPVERIADWLAAEIVEGTRGESGLGDIDRDPATDEPIRAGFIKLATSDAGLQEIEAKTLRAAVGAARKTGACIASHSPNAAASLASLDILEAAGGDPTRFIAVHTSSEPDFGRHLELARRGAVVEYDAVGDRPDDYMLALTLRLLEAGFGDRLLLSQDVCGHIVERPPSVRRFAYLLTDFLPKLRAAGVSDEQIRTILVETPRRVLALA
jgi:phosphotriesterase-related protein